MIWCGTKNEGNVNSGKGDARKKSVKRPIQTFPQNTKIYHGDEEVSPKKLQSSYLQKRQLFTKGDEDLIHQYLDSCI